MLVTLITSPTAYMGTVGVGFVYVICVWVVLRGLGAALMVSICTIFVSAWTMVSPALQLNVMPYLHPCRIKVSYPERPPYPIFEVEEWRH